MTFKELTSEWRNPKELIKGSLLAVLFLMVLIICILFDVEIKHRGVVLCAALVMALINVASLTILYNMIKNK
jgi:hypothetical protein